MLVSSVAADRTTGKRDAALLVRSPDVPVKRTGAAAWSARAPGTPRDMSTFRAGRYATRDRRTARSLEARATLARVLRLIGTVVAAIIVAGILLIVLGANQGNGIVNAVLDAARWLAGPFDGLFNLQRHKVEIAVNWGLAAVVYFAISRLLARLALR
jgi:hypothetical protein